MELNEVLTNPIPLWLVKAFHLKPFICHKCHDEEFQKLKFYDVSLCSRQYVNKF